MKYLFFSILTLGLISQIYASEHGGDKDNRVLISNLKQLFGEREFTVSDYNDQLKLVSSGASAYFSSHDGRYLFTGQIIDTKTGRDIVEVQRQSRRQALISSLPEAQRTRYPSKPEERYKVTIFTDIDCPYCRRMHSYMDAFNEKGITVDYVMLPRAGVNSPSFKRTASALCADKPELAITQAMKGEEPPLKNCAHTLGEQYQLAQTLGISATPATILPSGKIQAGLMTPEQLLHLLERD